LTRRFAVVETADTAIVQQIWDEKAAGAMSGGQK